MSPLLAAAQPLTGVEKIIITAGKNIQGSIQVSSQEDTVFTLNLVGKIRSFIISSQNEGVPLYNLSNSTLVVLIRGGDTINVTFVSIFEGDPSLILIPAWNQSLDVYLSSDYVILGVEPLPDAINKQGGFTVLHYTRLDSDLSLSLLEVSTEEGGGGMSTMTGHTQNTPGGLGLGFTWMVAGVFTALLILVVVLWFVFRRRKYTVLSEEEEEIIDFLKKSGGKAYLKDIREALDLPSTTALRRIRRLEERGLIRTLKTPGGLLVILS
ncbi:MAG: winged helix-turn-helix transcriptional regulator [Infirmifilum sp.]